MSAFSVSPQNNLDDRRLRWALAASLLLHLLLVAILVAAPWTWQIAKPPEPQEISMVFPEAPKSAAPKPAEPPKPAAAEKRSEEHTSELQSLMRISYSVFCLKKKKHKRNKTRM